VIFIEKKLAFLCKIGYLGGRMKIKHGDIVHGSRWAEPVEVNLLGDIGEYIRLVRVTLHSHKHIDQLIRRDELDGLSVGTLEADFTAPAYQVFLSLETKRYRYASLYDPLLAVNTSKVDPLPHQVEAVYGYVLKLPRIRFLISGG
jgi:hypothetical protein